VIEFNKALPRWRQLEAVLTATLLFALAGCTHSTDPAANQRDATLSIGYGENAEVGIQQAVRNIALEGLVRIDRDGRPRPWLAEQWTVSPDGLTWHLALRPGATFHNGQRATAQVIRDIVARDLPEYVGPAFDDVQQIQARTPNELEFLLKRRSSFLLEGLDLPIRQRGETPVGTGPFSVTSRTPSEVEMRASSGYYGGKPFIDRIVFRSYDSVRSAWADMLRGRVDMLYEVGVDALDSLSQSTQARTFVFQRPYAFLVLLNVRNSKLRDKVLRRALNDAIDRTALVADALDNHGTPADGPVWPHHWSYSSDLPRFTFQPTRVTRGNDVLQLRCLILRDQAHERIGLTIQRQLRSVGVELTFEQVTPEKFVARWGAGDFEAALGDYRMGPSLLRQYQFWYSSAPLNAGHFNSLRVDGALDRIRSAPDDAAYKDGVADFQSAIVDDPPAIFLAWGERLRAVSARFEVHQEPGRDITSTLRLWRPIADGRMISPN
jgi:peptide/nickel transport system substrate-binding protein